MLRDTAFIEIPPWPPHRRPHERGMRLAPVPIPATKQRRKEGNHVPAYPYFESIPLEIWDLIASFLDMEQLRAVVHASPILHQRYLRTRTLSLRQCLINSLNEAVLDETIAPIIADRVWTWKYSKNWVYYETWRTSAFSCMECEQVTKLEIIDTATFFNYFVVPLLRSYDAVERTSEARLSSREDRQGVADCGEAGPSEDQQSRRCLEEFEDDLHYFLIAFPTWRKYFGLGFMKKALLRNERLCLVEKHPCREKDTMVFYDD